MPEDQLFKTKERRSRSEIANILESAAEQLDSGTVELKSAEEERSVTVPEEPTFEVELERLTDSETGEQRFELEFEISWTK